VSFRLGVAARVALGLVLRLRVAVFAEVAIASAERPPATIIARYSSSLMPVIEPAIC